jgi:hypothetical protein
MVYFTLKRICQWQFYKIRIQNNSFEKEHKKLLQISNKNMEEEFDEAGWDASLHILVIWVSRKAAHHSVSDP